MGMTDPIADMLTRIRNGIRSRHPRVESFEDATPDRGGWGATVVKLRRDG